MVNHLCVLARQCTVALTVVVHGPQGFDDSISVMAVVHQDAPFAQGFLLRAHVRRHAWHPEQTCFADDPTPRTGRLEKNEVKIDAGEEGRCIYMADDASIRVVSEFLRICTAPCNVNFSLRPKLKQSRQKALIHPQPLLRGNDHDAYGGWCSIWSLCLLGGA